MISTHEILDRLWRDPHDLGHHRDPAELLHELLDFFRCPVHGEEYRTGQHVASIGNFVQPEEMLEDDLGLRPRLFEREQVPGRGIRDAEFLGESRCCPVGNTRTWLVVQFFAEQLERQLPDLLGFR